MTDFEAIAKVRKELDMSLYLAETSLYPGIQSVHRNKSEWLACVLRLAQKALNNAEKPKTNADRIRAMSDEELASLLIYFDEDFDIWRTDYGNCYDRETAIAAEVEWLQQSAEGE